MKALALLLALSAMAVADTYDIDAMMDTYTKPTGGCYGYGNELCLANYSASGHPDERVMIYFDLSGYMGDVLNSATLNVFAFFQCGSGQGTNTQIFAVTQVWDESWAGAHATHDPNVYQTYFFQNLGWHDIDVTSLVSDWLDGSVTNHGLVIKVLGVYPWTKLRSRETTLVPYLTVDIQEQALQQTTWGSLKASL
jgi:hypothetical protein